MAEGSVCTESSNIGLSSVSNASTVQQGLSAQMPNSAWHCELPSLALAAP
jgi:hypothetical protein